MDSRTYLLKSLMRFSWAISALAVGMYGVLVVTVTELCNVSKLELDYFAAFVPGLLFIFVTVLHINKQAYNEVDFLVLRLLLFTFVFYVFGVDIVTSFFKIPLPLYIRVVIGPLLVFAGICFGVQYQACVWYHANRLIPHKG